MTNLLLDWIVDGVAIAAVATLVSRLIPARSASARHAFWWFALVVIAAVPWLSSGSAGIAMVAPPGEPAAIAAGRPSWFVVPAPPNWLLRSGAAAWTATVLVSLGTLGASLLQVFRLVRSSRPLDAAREAKLSAFAAESRGGRTAYVRVSDTLRGACAVGFLRPQILLSSRLVDDLSDAELEAVVLHEYAHLQRYDDWTCLLQRLVWALAGLHPAVRVASRHIDIEREAACDRHVVGRLGDATAYARALTRAVEVMSESTGTWPAAVPGAAADAAGLHGRVSRLLTAERVMSDACGWGVMAASVATLTLAVGATTTMSPLVSADLSRSGLSMMTTAVQRPSVLAPEPSMDDVIIRETEERPAFPVSRPLTVGFPTPERDGRAVPMVLLAAASVVREVPLARDAPAAPETEQKDEPLASPRSSPIAVPALAPGAMRVRAQGSGAAAGRFVDAGAALADGATHAGVAVGNYFRSGGRAIARRF